MSGQFVRVWLPLVAGLFVVFATFFRGPGPQGPLRWAGLLLAVLGLLGVVVSRWTLGRSFSITPQARELMTHGIYSKIRNPIYVFGTICIAGLILMVRQNYLWALLVLIIVVQMIRARQESRVLEARFGDEYRKYRASTWF